MRQKRDFRFHWDRLCDIVRREGEIGDAFLMMELGFTPPVWKLWKSKFREISETTVVKGRDYSGVNYHGGIAYNEDQKLWRWVPILELPPD